MEMTVQLYVLTKPKHTQRKKGKQPPFTCSAQGPHSACEPPTSRLQTKDVKCSGQREEMGRHLYLMAIGL